MIDTLIDLVVSAGKQVMRIYDSDFTVDMKDDDSPVTKADRISDNIIMKGLEFTGYSVFSEESGKIGSGRFTWVIDGLDGTKDFIQKTGEFSIMVALLKDSRPIMGVVYAPAIDKLYYAEKEKGSFLITHGIKKRLIVDHEKIRAAVVSRNHFYPKDKKLYDALGLEKQVPLGSIGIKVGAIAQGLADITFYTSARLGVWDCAASEIMMKEAGGQVFDSAGSETTYDLDTGRMGTVGFIATKAEKQRITDALADL